MKTFSIIWDFDGTLLPNDPYDSEQSLMLYKLNETGEKVSTILRVMARMLIYADNKERLRQTFKRFYVWFLIGTHVAVLDKVSERLAAKISAADRKAIQDMSKKARKMIVLSCGTADLGQRTLKKAGLGDCFDIVEGNRFKIDDGQIAGMTYGMHNPQDKVKFLQKNGFSPHRAVAVGDGYTDIPLLDWARIAIIVDRSGEKKEQLRHKDYQFVASIPEIVNLI